MQNQKFLNGKLEHVIDVDLNQYNRLKQSIKYNSDCDISIHNKPQDGRLSHTIKNSQNEVDIRVSCIPSAFGEDIVLYNLEKLGFSSIALESIDQMLLHKNGLILVTGPTGSGKTTTLYAMLETLKQNLHNNIISLEDPIESIIPGIRQSQINSDIGYTFEEGLKYPEDSAGRLMQRKFVAISNKWNVGKSIDYLRKTNKPFVIHHIKG